MSSTVDLNHLRDLVNSNATSGRPHPPNEEDRVYVEPSGAVVLGRDQPGNHRKLSEVHQGVFAAMPAAEATVACEKLPENARYVDENGMRGWLYEFTNDLGDDYVFFVYRNASGLYFASMVLPEVDITPNVHVAHLFDNGAICLSQEVGLPSLEQCFGRTVIFSIGWSTYVRTGSFPFAGERA
jgi:hypothetical protein